MMLLSLVMGSMSVPVRAQSSAHLIKFDAEKEMIRVTDDCGYCSRSNTYLNVCTIDTNGVVKIERHRVRKKSDHKETHYKKISNHQTQRLIKWIQGSANYSYRGTGTTYAGDAASFSVDAWLPENRRRHVKIATYSYGFVINRAPHARLLERVTAEICGMNHRRMMWQVVSRLVF